MQIKASLVVVPSLVGVGLAWRPYPTPPFEPPPCTILSSLYSAVPASVSSEFQENPRTIAWYFSEVEETHTPTWYPDVPENVKSVLYSAYNTDAMAASMISFLSAFESGLSEAKSNLPPPPSSIVSEMASVYPFTTRLLETPTMVYDTAVDIEYGHGDPPPWFTKLPDDAQSWFSSAGSSIVNSFEKALSDSVTAAASTACWSAVQITDSTDAGPTPTSNDLAIGAAGVAGILGLALAL